MTEISTPRLVMRCLTVSDVGSDYVRWLNDPNVITYLEVRHAPKQTMESIVGFVEECENDSSSLLFGIFLKDGGKHIGNIKLGAINRHYSCVEVGIMIGESEARGKGYGAEALRFLCDFANNTLMLHKITAGCYADNLSSLRIFLKTGFQVEGFMRDQVIHNGHPQGVFLLGRVSEN